MNWIEVCDWVPYEDRVCLVCDAINKIISLGRHIEDNEWELMSMHGMTADVCITHWMELPDFPEEE